MLVPPLLVPPLLVPPLLVPSLLVPPLLVLPLLVPPLLVPPLLVLPLLVSPLLRFHALVLPLLRVQALVGLPMVQRRPLRICYFLDCPRKFRLRQLWWLKKKALDFTRAGGHGNVQSKFLLSFFLQHRRHRRLQARTFIRRIHHNEVEKELQDTF